MSGTQAQETLAQARERYAERLAEADRIRDQAKAEWVAALRETQAQGVSLAAIADQLGVSRQRIAVLLRD